MESKLNTFFLAKRVPKTFHFGGFLGPFLRGKVDIFVTFCSSGLQTSKKYLGRSQKYPKLEDFGPNLAPKIPICGPFGTSRGTFWSSGVFKWPKNHPKKVDFCYFCEKNTHVFIFLVPCLKYFLLVFFNDFLKYSTTMTPLP